MSVTKNYFKFELICIKIMIMTFKALGLAPYTVENSKRISQNRQRFKNVKFSLSRRDCFYNLCLVVLQTGMMFVSSPSILKTSHIGKFKMLTTIITYLLCNFTMFMIWLIFLLRQKTATKLLNRLLSIGRASTVTYGDHQVKTSWGFFLLTYFTTVSMWLILLSISLIKYRSVFPNDSNSFVAPLGLAWYVIQYVFVVKFIEIRFRGLNLQLSKRSVLFSFNSLRQSLTRSKFSQNDARVAKVMMIRREYESLCNVSSEISAFYSLPILFTISYFSCAMVSTSFEMVTIFVFQRPELSSLILVNLVLEVAVFLVPLILLACGVSNVHRQVIQSANIIRGLLTFSDTSDIGRIQLHFFMMELRQRKIRFTACGLFSLDCTLLYSMISMFTTYIIILIQFNI